MSGVYQNIALLYADDVNDLKSAIDYYNKAIDVCKQLPKDNPEYQNDLSWIYSNFADLQRRQLHFDLAETYINKAIEIREQLPNDNPEYQSDLAKAYYNLAQLQKNNLKNFVLANKNYRKAIKILEQLPNDNPEYKKLLSLASSKLDK